MIERILNLDKKQFLIYAFAIALIIRIAFFIVFADFDEPEMWEHGDIAVNIIEGNGFTMHWPYPSFDEERLEQHAQPREFGSAFIPPLNPYLLAGVFGVTGVNPVGYTTIYTINALLSALASLLVFYIALMLFNEKAARFATIFSIIFLPAIYGIITFSGSPLYHLLVLLSIYLLIKSLKSNNLLLQVLVGIALGLSSLIRSEFLALSLSYIGLIFLLKIKSFGFRKSLLSTVLIAIAFAAVVTPWTIRNTAIFGQIVPVVSHPWHEIWRGNNPNATGGSTGKNGVVWLHQLNSPELIPKLDSLPYDARFEIAADSVFKDAAQNYIKADPANYLYLAGKRVLFLLTVDIYTPRAYDLRYSIFIVLSFIFSVLGIRLLFKKSQQNRDFGAFLVYLGYISFYLLLIAVVNLETRYQVYFYSTLQPIVGIGIYSIYKMLNNKN